MAQSSMELLWKSAHIAGGNANYVEALYDSYLRDPNTVPEEWRNYFDSLPQVPNVMVQDVPHSTIREQFLQIGQQQRWTAVPQRVDREHQQLQVRVLQLIDSYRHRGHQKARLDPLELTHRAAVPDLELTYHGLSTADFPTRFQTGSPSLAQGETTLQEIVATLEQTYCQTVGVEYMHIVDSREKLWLQQRLESVRSHPNYSVEVKHHLLERLVAAEGLEKLLGSRYPGTKRFGLEGGESLIPLLDELIQRAGSYGAKEIVIGMAHRGRLNVLVNNFGKNPADLFEEFEGIHAHSMGSGDVKYHQGFSSNVMTPAGQTHLALAFNPSHLEIVSPVVAGSVRARQDRRGDLQCNQVVPVAIHGDAAFAGQGVVMETLQMSQTRAYRIGGTIHIIVNNQVGFTTNKREDARSTEYCTDVAKMVQAPIFHVNGDDPEAVLFVTQVAVDYRNEFKRDVVVDLVCYRRRGHNEADEPSGTQALMYARIRNLPTTLQLYADKLVNSQVITRALVDEWIEEYRNALEQGQHVVKSLVTEPNLKLFVDWSSYLGHDYWSAMADTRFDLKRLQQLASEVCAVPEGVVMQRQVAKIIEDRGKMIVGALPLNWGFAEVMAYATLLTEGYPIRLIGQDSGRGTFSHRHAVIHSQKDDSTYVPLANIAGVTARFTLHDSLLSEEAALAFEYGYATTNPRALVIWEAQFGDFVNGAQVVIDQFIASGETKWGRMCGLVMFLPHGYEGQGPEHSSARLERFMQLCAEHNIQVCIPTTPAQIFHLLRRQALRPLRKPLIVMTPKSLLRHKLAISSLEDLADGEFKLVIAETAPLDAEKVKRIVLCSGKVYYDLIEAREAAGCNDVAVIRIEQFYPFPHEQLQQAMAPFAHVQDVIWCQEEPMNQGVWYSSQHHMNHVLQALNPGWKLKYVGREASAAPATGYLSLHVEQQERLVKEALGIQQN